MVILFPERERFWHFFPDRESKMGNPLISRTGKIPHCLLQVNVTYLNVCSCDIILMRVHVIYWLHISVTYLTVWLCDISKCVLMWHILLQFMWHVLLNVHVTYLTAFALDPWWQECSLWLRLWLDCSFALIVCYQHTEMAVFIFYVFFSMQFCISFLYITISYTNAGVDLHFLLCLMNKYKDLQ